MSISELRDGLQRRLADFLWGQWAQMGLSANTGRRDTWAEDPEALLLLTLEVGRGEPRLFEEVLDWMVVNERLISVQRLRNLAGDNADRALVDAVLGWLGENRRRARLGAKANSEEEREPRPFFRDSHLDVADPDPAFLAQGFLKPRIEPSGKSQAPDLRLPINFAFRLRLLLGIGVRAEVVRVLLTLTPPWTNAQALSASTAYSKRNVQEAMGALIAVGVVGSRTLGNQNRFVAEPDRWTAFLDLKRLPQYEDWPRFFLAYRRILRWLSEPANSGLSDYMLLSRARTLVEEVGPDLPAAEISPGPDDLTRDLPSFGRFVNDLTEGFV